MRITILGSAAGGGFPQWNCACRNCSRFRGGQLRSRARSQAQVVVSRDSGESYLINASPDLRTQILSASFLAPAKAIRHTPIAGVLLTSADVDSLAGLLHLREFQPLRIYATPSVRRTALEENRIFRVLNRANPPAIWQDFPLDTWFALTGADSQCVEAQIRCRAVSLGGSYPDYVSDGLRRPFATDETIVRLLAPDEAIVGLALDLAGKQVFCAPALPGGSDAWKEWVRSSDVSLLDGTFWCDNELIAAGVGRKTAREIGHVPLSGPGGLLEKLGPSTRGRRILFHINNTNPILDEESPEYREVRDAGWEIAYDGMQIEL
jgi:pyrroloquinoline quinone biosynthesis protein B